MPPAERPQHYFSEAPAGRSERRAVTLALPDLRVELTTDRGVFSGDAVDVGTRHLLLEAPMPATGDEGCVLDLGCGYGPITVALGHRLRRARIIAVDVNERARALCATNVERTGLTNVRVFAPEDVPAGMTFAAIYSNPPIRIGKAALHELLRHWLGRLEPGGRAVLVVHKHLGSDSLQRWLQGEGSGWSGSARGWATAAGGATAGADRFRRRAEPNHSRAVRRRRPDGPPRRRRHRGAHPVTDPTDRGSLRSRIAPTPRTGRSTPPG
ncbi:MAG: methyltransferase [Acidimicrobiales bacterium]